MVWSSSFSCVSYALNASPGELSLVAVPKIYSSSLVLEASEHFKREFRASISDLILFSNASVEAATFVLIYSWISYSLVVFESVGNSPCELVKNFCLSIFDVEEYFAGLHWSEFACELEFVFWDLTERRFVF